MTIAYHLLHGGEEDLALEDVMKGLHLRLIISMLDLSEGIEVGLIYHSLN